LWNKLGLKSANVWRKRSLFERNRPRLAEEIP
jgi:hypothetical protein